MKSNPLVSVIITCYNYKRYVGEAIESVLGQSYQNFELIIINDGSTDDSIKVIDKYKNHPKVSIINRENKGIIFTRNEGVRLSSGEFMFQLDADDSIEPTYIEECVKTSSEYNADIVYTQENVHGRVEYITEHIEYNLEMMKHENYMHAASFVRRSIVDDDPYDIYLEKLGNEDWDFFLNLCLKGARAKLIDKPLKNYRKHNDKSSRADNFEGMYNEALVTHHVWQKQNDKYPEEFWYFSPQIRMLEDIISMYGKYNEIKSDYIQMQNQVIDKERILSQTTSKLRQLEMRDPISIAARAVRKVQQLVNR